MYFNVETQSQVIDRFHFALREGGYLFLGKAEMLLSDGERFEAVSMRQRIFRRRPGVAVPRYQTVPMRFDIVGGPEIREVNRKRQLLDLALEAAPFGAIGVDAEGTVAVLNTQMRTLFGMSARDLGRPFHDLEISYRPVELRSLIVRAHAEHRVIRVNSVERRVGGDDAQYFDIHIHPLWGTDGLSAGVMVTFVDTTLTTRLQLEVKRNREELDTAHEELQSTNEELETTNEELQSSIEELETTNEELQSTNEELETTNEELQSGNEELETMNEEIGCAPPSSTKRGSSSKGCWAAWPLGWWYWTPNCWSGAGTRGQRNSGDCVPMRCAIRFSSTSTSGCRSPACATSYRNASHPADGRVRSR